MATLKIEPIEVASRGKNRVVITGLDPTDHDCIVGQYWLGRDGPHNGSWNLSGLLRDGDESRNLDMNEGSLSELAILARQLGAKP